MSKTPVQFQVNGQGRAVFVEDAQNLLDTLRCDVGDMSPKYGCGQGTCGACTVLIDGEPHLSCLVLAQGCHGKTIETTGGLADGPNLHPLQVAFMENFSGPMRLLHSGHVDGGQGFAQQESEPNARGCG